MPIDFIRLCRDYNIDHRIDVQGWVNINCPYHSNGDRGYKGGLNISGGYYNCWTCGVHNVENVLADILDCTYQAANLIVKKYATNEITHKRKKKSKHAKDAIALPIDTLDDRCKRYLCNRNFDPELLQQKYKLCGATCSGEWAGRLIIPIIYNSEVVSFQGRSLLSKERCKELNILRYKTLSKEKSIIDPKHILYGLDDCKENHIVLVEGAPDKWRWGENCAATLGTSVTTEQINIMVQYKNIYIIFDPEKEAQERAEKLALILAAVQANAIIVNTELPYDMGDMSPKEIERLKRKLHI